ncbi:2-oxoglutarate dehydrogenase E2 component (dihydrolipoamide succinyltransferase) [Ereboglobus sp. PH5-5]|uniref:2-oxoglutarate dehydrogenase complex dihydrolipoyllysine-residue succinyltransferase n=1 Tax=Ereboglobus sp. PH5-5 TaxID=2940529 RepID=UPI002406EDA9|nr:2-oxoglutarate dehydrogenase complex dihydrolipoyllysine-residue succinyltransferase [Ereboglobus sp. PH5-5]MDF9834038.1 2-oxoglutarate dehydrogenase E2 component (dihydrolipoamide succinyltransferase) [Ereboglobus sp. PH5-5]
MSLLEVKIPPVGESITSGILAKWHVADGEIVKQDQPIFELETDKITSEATAEAAGKITLKVADGAEVKIGQVVATIDTSVGASLATPGLSGTGDSPVAPGNTNTPPASPAVQRLAAETGIDPATIQGTGKDGRVTKADMLGKAEALKAESLKAQSTPPAPPQPSTFSSSVLPSERQTRKKMSPLRKRIAERLVQAQHQAAMLTTFNECDMSAVISLRTKYQDDFVKRHGIKLGFMSFFTKAVVHALQAVPAINAQIDGDTIIQNNYYDIGVAVSSEKGLMVPVLRDCDKAGLADIEKQLAALAKKARDAKITLPELEGGVFTITNGGIFGSMLSTPIINTPQSAILGLHAINDRPVAMNGQVVIRPMMYLALSYDHRLVDGKEAVTFLVKVKQAIEDPALLMLGV